MRLIVLIDPNVGPSWPLASHLRRLSGRLLSLRIVGAGTCGAEGWGFESLRARSVETDEPGLLTSANAGGGLARSPAGRRSPALAEGRSGASAVGCGDNRMAGPLQAAATGP